MNNVYQVVTALSPHGIPYVGYIVNQDGYPIITSFNRGLEGESCTLRVRSLHAQRQKKPYIEYLSSRVVEHVEFLMLEEMLTSSSSRIQELGKAIQEGKI